MTAEVGITDAQGRRHRVEASPRLLKALEDIQPGEKRVLEPVAEPDAARNRWYKVREPGTIPYGLLAWQNRPEFLPRAPDFNAPQRPMTTIEKPKLVFFGRPDQLSDFYGYNDSFFVSKRVFELLRQLDPESVEWIECPVERIESTYFYCLCRRVLDGIDEERTRIEVSSEEISPDRYMKMVRFSNLHYALREDIPKKVHCFVPMFTSHIVWSRDLVDAVIAAGARNIDFKPPFSDLERDYIRV